MKAEAADEKADDAKGRDVDLNLVNNRTQGWVKTPRKSSPTATVAGAQAAAGGGGLPVTGTNLSRMEIKDLRGAGGREITAYESRGLTAEALVRSDVVALTILRVAEGGEIGRHPTDSDQFLLVLSGRGSVRSGDGPWEPIEAGQLVIWRTGEVHTTRADEALTAYVLEAPGLLP